MVVGGGPPVQVPDPGARLGLLGQIIGRGLQRRKGGYVGEAILIGPLRHVACVWDTTPIIVINQIDELNVGIVIR
jgi:hypothetical protein